MTEPNRLTRSQGIALAASALACLASAGRANAASQVPAPTDLVTPGKLTFLTAASAPPFEYKKNGQYTGFDFDMIHELAGYMGLDPQPIDLTFDGLIPALLGNRADIINSSMYITAKRAVQVDFVPYLKIGEAIMVPASNPKNIHSVDDLSGRDVAVTRGAIEQTYATEQNEAFAKQGKPPENIVSLPTELDSALAVEQGRADAFFTYVQGGTYLLQQRPGVFKIAGVFAFNTRLGIATRKGDTAMKQSIDQAMNLFVKSGSYKALLAKYQFPAESSIF